jgi:methylglutaconyl-CoA hydratase
MRDQYASLGFCLTQKGAVARITLNRPDKHNALNEDLIQGLLLAIQSIEDDSSIRILVLDAKGKHFSAGADLYWMQRMAGYSQQENQADAMQLAELMNRLYQCSKITVAIIQGAAYGGAIGLIACCDIALASDDARFCFSEVKLGLIPAVISPYVVKAIGERQSKRYFLSAEIFHAKEALHMQLIHKIFLASVLKTDSESYIQDLLQHAPQAMMAIKPLIHAVQGQTINAELIKLTTQRIADIRVSKEGQEGIYAFLEKRSPQWDT